MSVSHIPVLRGGRPYRSLTTRVLKHVGSGEPVAELSLANPGLVARDLMRSPQNQRALQAVPSARLVEIFRDAAHLFMEGTLALGGEDQSPQVYVEQLSATSGMPQSLCRANMEKIRFVLAEIDQVLAGLSRGLDLEALDRGWGIERGRTVSYARQTDVLGVVLPSNSPGVHALWIPAIALKVPLALKPGSLEPWTPYRVAQALLAAGCPAEAIGYYPAEHAGATELLLRCGRSMLFGDRSTVGAWADDPRVELHGPGWSKVLVGEDQLASWRDLLGIMATSIAANGGRSCVNASGIWLPGRGREVAQALAGELVAIEALPLAHPRAALAAFPEPAVAHRISAYLDQQLAIPGAVDLTAELRGGGRVVELEGLTYLLPTLVWCEDAGHPLAQTELLFPFASVVEVPQEEMLGAIGSSLVVSALTEDPAWIAELMSAPHVERLNLGSIPTCQVAWDQPHEGNLFDHLYRQRSFQSTQTLERSAEAALTPAG